MLPLSLRRAAAASLACVLFWTAPGAAAHAAVAKRFAAPRAGHAAPPARVPVIAAARPALDLGPGASAAVVLAADRRGVDAAGAAPRAAAAAGQARSIEAEAARAASSPDGRRPAPAPSGGLMGRARRLAGELSRRNAPRDPEPPPQEEEEAEGEFEAAPVAADQLFVPAEVQVRELLAAEAQDRDAAYALAVAKVQAGPKVSRQVKLTALALLARMPMERVLPFYIQVLEESVQDESQKARSAVDLRWYVLREVLLRLSREPQDSSELDALLRKASLDREPSVRVAAAAALKARGLKPLRWLGPEPVAPADPAAKEPAKPAAPTPYFRPGGMFPFLGAVILAAILALVLASSGSASRSPERPHQVQTEEVPMPPDWRQPAPEARVQPPVLSPTPTVVAPDMSPEEIAAARRQALEARMVRALEEQAAAARIQAAEQSRQNDILERVLSTARRGGGGGLGGPLMSLAVMLGGMVLFYKFIMPRLMGGGGQARPKPNAGKSGMAQVERPATRFSDVEGVSEAAVELSEIVEFLTEPERFQRVGAKIPKGALLLGPPGTGKTLIARATAGESNAAFFSFPASEFVEMFVGVGASRVRDLIRSAAQHKPAIIFIDEIDAVGKKRGGPSNGGNDEREQTLNQLLVEMDGFDHSSGIVFIAATNRADTLDPALLRRFTVHVNVDPASQGGRAAQAVVHSRGKPLAPEVTFDYIDRRTPGVAGAGIENIMNTAALYAARRHSRVIELKDIDRAIDAQSIGADRHRPMTAKTKLLVGRHEGGHALAVLAHPDEEVRAAFTVNKYTVIPRARADGFAEIVPTDEGDSMSSYPLLLARLDYILGGLVAEEMYYGAHSAGPQSDLVQATRLARAMVQRFGMGRGTGLSVTAPEEGDPLGRTFGGDLVEAQVKAEVDRLLDEAKARVKARFERNRHVLEAMVEAVLEKETLMGDEIQEVVKKAGLVFPKPGEPEIPARP